MVGWIQIEAHDVTHLLDEKGVGRELETATAMGLQNKGLKPAMHRGFGNAAGLGRLPHAPVGRACGLAGDGSPQQAAILSSSRVRGRPAQFIVQTASRCSTKRCRHLPTVAWLQRRRRAIVLLLPPSADHSTILARDTRAWGKLREPAQASR